MSGPGSVGLGSGDKISTYVNYQPWCNADFSNCTYTTGTISMQASGTPAEVGDIVTINSHVTGNNVYAMQLRVSYDATALQFQAPPASSHNNVTAAVWYWDYVPEAFVAVTGGTRLSGSIPTHHPNPATLAGESVATWKFKCLKAGTFNLIYDATVGTGTYLATKDGFNIPANLVNGQVTCSRRQRPLTDGSSCRAVNPPNSLPAAWQGADVTLTCLDPVNVGCNGFPPYTMTTDASGHYQS